MAARKKPQTPAIPLQGETQVPTPPRPTMAGMRNVKPERHQAGTGLTHEEQAVRSHLAGIHGVEETHIG